MCWQYDILKNGIVWDNYLLKEEATKRVQMYQREDVELGLVNEYEIVESEEE